MGGSGRLEAVKACEADDVLDAMHTVHAWQTGQGFDHQPARGDVDHGSFCRSATGLVDRFTVNVWGALRARHHASA